MTLLIVLRDHEGCETFLNLTRAAQAVGFDMDALRYAGVRVVTEGTDGIDLCGVTYPGEQQTIAYLSDTNLPRAKRRLARQTRQDAPFFATITGE